MMQGRIGDFDADAKKAASGCEVLSGQSKGSCLPAGIEAVMGDDE